MTSWTDTTQQTTSWTTVDPEDGSTRTFTLSEGSPMGLGLVLTYAENQTISTSSGVAWVDDEDVRTAWTEPTDDSTTRTYTLQAGNPMGLLLGITYADTVTVTETSGVAWTELDQTITSWTEE